jgi:hypothetical protein
MPTHPDSPPGTAPGDIRALVDRALDELRPENGTAPHAGSHAPGAIADLPAMLLRAYSEICGVLQSLRSSRDALEQATIEKLHHTNAKLHEVSSATEVAATGMLDGLDRALAMVDELDTLDSSGDARAAEVRGQLRDELFQAISGLQFQDITTQQLNYASSVLVDMEQRLAEVAKAFDPSTAGIAVPSSRPTAPAAFDPGASLDGADERQALVDQIFKAID